MPKCNFIRAICYNFIEYPGLKYNKAKYKFLPIACGNSMTVITFRFIFILGKNSTIQGFQNL